MKKRIRLTEGQLRKVVKEAVLDELDWRTAANAYQKAADKVYYSPKYPTPEEEKNVKRRFRQKQRFGKYAEHELNNNGLTKHKLNASYGERPLVTASSKMIYGPKGMESVYWNSNGGDIDNYCTYRSYYDKKKGKWMDPIKDADYDKDSIYKQPCHQHPYVDIFHQPNESVVRRVTESVIRKLNEWYFHSDDCINFDDAEDALRL